MTKDGLDEMFKHLKEIMSTAGKLKTVMLKKGLTRARCKCPREGCWGIIHGSLNGKKSHIHMGCDNPACYMRMME